MVSDFADWCAGLVSLFLTLCCHAAADVEEDEFQRYRDQLCAELLGSLFQSLGLNLCNMVGIMLQNGMASSDWRTVEACLFAVRSIHTELKAYLRRQQSDGATDNVSAMSTFLTTVITSPHALLSSNVVVLASFCRLVGSYSVWLAAQAGLVDGVVELLVGAVGIADAADVAIAAIRNLSSRSGASFLSGDRLQRLVQHLHALCSEKTAVTTEAKCALANVSEAVVV